MDFVELVLAGLVVLVVLAVAAVGVGAWQESKRPTFELKKDDWECVKDERRTHLQPMLVGKVTIMQPVTTTVCLEYRRIGG